METLLYYLYFLGKNNTYKSLKDSGSINVYFNNTTNKTVSLILSRNASNHSKALLESSIISYVKDISDSIQAFETEKEFDSTAISTVLHILILSHV